jgi:hypothetical protein
MEWLPTLGRQRKKHVIPNNNKQNRSKADAYKQTR